MSSMGSVTIYLERLRSPDCRERDEAARIIWERFSARLLGLVRRHLDNRIRRREDEQDVLQSVYATFCIGQLNGKTSPASREELWKLLVRITMCTVVNTAHRHLAARRDVRRERADAHDSPAPDRSFLAGCSTMLTAPSRATRKRSLCSRRSIACSTGFPVTSAAS